jgi:fluoroacetyl-CoA thioesterase
MRAALAWDSKNGQAGDVDIVEGQTAVIEAIVKPEMTASAAADRAGERFPDVLGTPALVCEMERAAASLMQGLLGSAQVSVGVQVDIKHLAPTPVGAALRSYARYTGRDGKLFCFDVWSEDPAGLVGKGRHSRAIVELSLIESKAAQRGLTFSQGGAAHA